MPKSTRRDREVALLAAEVDRLDQRISHLYVTMGDAAKAAGITVPAADPESQPAPVLRLVQGC
jgi:hypothetical protein